MPTEYDARERGQLRRRLLAWFDTHQRDLPWRRRERRHDPYSIWVSEIMLQQTQVATVIPYYERFLQRFPNVGELAAAAESELLSHWEGLGCYRRARQMHQAARVIRDQHGGRFPETPADVLALPGIGRYTMGAILSIARGQPLPILEGNTIRLFARLLAMTEDPRDAAGQKRLWAFSESLLPRQRVGDFNQALMELGALVCRATEPACVNCPIAKFCRAFQEGHQDTIPRRQEKTYEAITEAVVLVQRRSRFLVRQCRPGERWAGLWDFPRFRVDNQPDSDPANLTGLIAQLRNQTGLSVQLSEGLPPIKHAVTRYRITLLSFHTDSVRGRLKSGPPMEWQWVSRAELADLPLSTTGRKLARQLDR